MPRIISRAVALAVSAAAITLSPLAITGSQADGPGSGTPWVVSVGDSYISGEAGRWAGNTDRSESLIDAGGPTTYDDNASHTAETIPDCHRSSSADIYIGDGVNGLDLACSGAETATVPSDSNGYFKPGIDFYDGSQGEGQALMLQNFAADHDVTMVAVSIGGNDFGFGAIVKDCLEDYLLSTPAAPHYCSSDAVVQDEVSPATVATVTSHIAAAFDNIRTAMRNAGYADDQWTLMVQNYPSPLPPGASIRYSPLAGTRQSVGGCGFWNKDADYANSTLLPTIDGAVANAETVSGLTNVKTLDVRSAFDGRRLCEKGVDLVEDAGPGITSWKSPGAVDKTEWINRIRIVTTGTDYYTQESLHPNHWGQLALRNCMRQAYNDGSPISGTCTHRTGLNRAGEPNMAFN